MQRSSWLKVKVRPTGNEQDFPKTKGNDDEVQGHVYNGTYDEFEKAKGGIEPTPESNVHIDTMIP